MDAINVVTRLLNEANIEINGDNPWDIQVRDERFYSRILADGSLGLGEAYMEGWYDCKNLDQFIFNLLRGNLEEKDNAEVLVTTMAEKFKHLFNPQTINNCKKDISFHYDIGNNLFKHMLDPRMVYSCAYWKDAKDLNEAQEAKLDLICRKLDLKPGMTLLDVGCGWGSFMKYAAEKYGVICTGLTLSKEQITLQIHPVEEVDQVNENLKVELYKIIQELLTNALKHAKATQIDIQLSVFNNTIQLLFEDDGVGFDQEKVKYGLGFQNLKDRLKTIKGNILINSFPKRGTVIDINVPLN